MKKQNRMLSSLSELETNERYKTKYRRREHFEIRWGNRNKVEIKMKSVACGVYEQKGNLSLSVRAFQPMLHREKGETAAAS